MSFDDRMLEQISEARLSQDNIQDKKQNQLLVDIAIWVIAAAISIALMTAFMYLVACYNVNG